MESDKVQDMLAGVEYDIKELMFKEALGKFVMEQIHSPIVDKFEAVAAKEPKRPCVIYDDVVYTYEAIDNLANRMAVVAKSWGMKANDCAVIMIRNEPAYVWTFLGLQKLGVTVALVNHQLTLHPLVHSIQAVDCTALIVGSDKDLLDAVQDVLPQLGLLQVYAAGARQRDLPHGVYSLDDQITAALPVTVCPTARSVQKMTDTCCYIYTSGTTGIPKPVYVSHVKYLSLSSIPRFLIGLGPDDITYIVLPLYHSTGMLLGLGSTFLTGSCMVLRKKFSAQYFWSDCRRYKVTNFPYIGELMRYLLTQPKSDLDGVHNLKAVYGAGLRADIYDEVKTRFKLPILYELYGATEAYTAILNFSNKPGAVGRLSPLLSKFDIHKKVLVEFDIATAKPIRNKEGRCIPVPIGKPGLLLSKVPDNLWNQKLYKSSFEDTEKKLVRDVFAPGDAYMNYGDAFVCDKEYYLYFNDRLGDTYRWKGENVSTTEVANVLSLLPFIEDASVYGVVIPGHDGKAGMAALTLNPGSRLGNKELQELHAHVYKELTSYARPLFIRHLPSAIITGTFKNRKVELVQEAYDLNVIKDPIYYLDRTKKTYSPLTKGALASFISSKL